MTIELDEKGDQVLVDGHRYSRVMPGTLDSQVWIRASTGSTSRQTTPSIIEIEDDDEDGDDVEIIEDDDDDIEYEGEIPRLSARQSSIHPRMFPTPYCTPAPPTHRHSTVRDFGKRRQANQEREMSIISAVGDDWPLASVYRIPSGRVKQVVREATSHGLYARVIPRSRVVPVPVENDDLPWIKEEYEEEDSGYFESFGEGGSGRMLNGNGNAGGGRVGKVRERDRDWEVILGTDEGAVEHLQQIVLNDQEEERQEESRRTIGRHHHRHHPPPVANNPPPPPQTTPVGMIVPQPPQSGTNLSNILMAMIVGAMAMFYVLLKMPDD